MFQVPKLQVKVRIQVLKVQLQVPSTSTMYIIHALIKFFITPYDVAPFKSSESVTQSVAALIFFK